MLNHQTPDYDATRRRVLGGLVAFFGMLWSIMAAYPLFRYLNPPREQAGQGNVTSVTVAPVSEIPPGTGRNFQFGSIPALVVHTEDGQLHAFNATCTHLGCTVQYRADMDRIWCACHGGQYDPVTGRNIAGPPPSPLAQLSAEVRDEQVVVFRA